MAASLAWGNYDNGRIPADALSPIGRGFLLERVAALQFLAARAFILLASGVDILNYISETYRDWDGQVYQKRRWTALGKPGNAADPGYSIHGWAKAIDWNADALNADGIYDYVMSVLEMFGFIRDVSGESWHTSFREANVTQWASEDTAPAQPAKTPEQLEEEELMSAEERIINAIAGKKAWLILRNHATGEITAVAPGNVVHVPTLDHLILGQRTGILPPEPPIDLPGNEYDFWVAFHNTSEQNDNTAVELLQRLSVDEVRKLNADAPKHA